MCDGSGLQDALDSPLSGGPVQRRSEAVHGIRHRAKWTLHAGGATHRWTTDKELVLVEPYVSSGNNWDFAARLQ
jgi:hypothetical protein